MEQGKNFLNKIDNSLDTLVDKMSKFDDVSNLKTRIVSGAIMLLIAIFAICVSKTMFILLAVAISVLMAFEWTDLTKTAPTSDKTKWRLIGFFFILLPVFSVLKLYDIDSNIVLWMFAVIFATDIFAYFAGKNFGGPKLMPKVSPNKTWAGLAGGVVASMVIGFLSSFMFPSGGWLFFVIVSALLSVVEQLSDLTESKVKRTFGVKDSGSLIPGHGGILDRLDGMILVAPLTLMIVCFNLESFIS